MEGFNGRTQTYQICGHVNVVGKIDSKRKALSHAGSCIADSLVPRVGARGKREKSVFDTPLRLCDNQSLAEFAISGDW